MKNEKLHGRRLIFPEKIMGGFNPPPPPDDEKDGDEKDIESIIRWLIDRF